MASTPVIPAWQAGMVAQSIAPSSLSFEQQRVKELRQQLFTNGFRYVPAEYKQARGDEWGDKARAYTAEIVASHTPNPSWLNTGILCDGLLAVDIDVDDAATVAQIRSLARLHLGGGPERSRENTAHTLLLYRAVDGLPKHPDLKGANDAKIQLLGQGLGVSDPKAYQFIADGVLKDGSRYTWTYSPVEFTRDQLTEVTAETLAAFLAAVAPLIGASQPTASGNVPQAISGQGQGPIVEPTPDDLVYCQTAISREREKYRALRNERNIELCKLAKMIGNFIPNYRLDPNQMYGDLMDDAAANGYIAAKGNNGADLARKTIQHNLQEGATEPRELKSVETARLLAGVDISAVKSSKLERKWPKPIGEQALVGIPGEFVRLIAPQSEGDASALLVAVLTVIGATFKRGAYLQISADQHYSNLFAVLVAESSRGRKGTVSSEAERFVKMIDVTMGERIVSGLSSGEGLIEAVRDAREEDVRQKDGSAVRQIVDTGVDDKRLLVIESEMGQVLQVAGRDGNTLSTTIRNSWDGKELRTLARSNKNVCRKPHVAIFGNITLDELQSLLTATDRANGFANRFLWVCAKRSQELPWGGNVDVIQLSQLAAQAAIAIRNADGFGRCSWTLSASKVWPSHYSRLSKEGHGLLAAVTARAATQVIRIALIYALLDGQNNISKQHLEAALEVWRYCEDSCAYIFGSATGNATADEIERMLQSKPEGASQTEISKHFGRHKSSEELQKALATLQEAGRIVSEQIHTSGRPASIWRVV
jgi:hypothetical protein